LGRRNRAKVAAAAAAAAAASTESAAPVGQLGGKLMRSN